MLLWNAKVGHWGGTVLFTNPRITSTLWWANVGKMFCNGYTVHILLPQCNRSRVYTFQEVFRRESRFKGTMRANIVVVKCSRKRALWRHNITCLINRNLTIFVVEVLGLVLVGFFLDFWFWRGLYIGSGRSFHTNKTVTRESLHEAILWRRSLAPLLSQEVDNKQLFPSEQ